MEKCYNVKRFLNQESFQLFDKGKGVAGFGRNDRITKGSFYIGLYNDNQRLGLDVDIKVLVVKEIKIYENVTYDRQREEPQYVTLQKSKIKINETRVRVPVE